MTQARATKPRAKKKGLAVYRGPLSQEWRTPPELFARLNAVWSFTLDAAATDENHLVERYYTKETDGLAHSWAGEIVFLNPPYARKIIDKWIEKAYTESLAKTPTVVVCLIPFRASSWWMKYVTQAAYVRPLGRLRFHRPDGTRGTGASFDSAIVIFGPLGGV